MVSPPFRFATSTGTLLAVVLTTTLLVLGVESFTFTTSNAAAARMNHIWQSTAAATTSSTSLFESSSSDDDADATSSVSKSDEAAALTEFMARAHEEKIRAMNRVEKQYKGQIEELMSKIEELEGPNTGSEATSANSFAFPATNKHLTEKVAEYQSFISDYMVKSQIEKQLAVKAAEDKLIAKYEAMLSSK